MFKFLDPTGCTYHDGQVFQYNLPQRGEKWSAWTEHPDPARPDEDACGLGRLHLMKGLDARYAPNSWWPWFAQGRNFIGEDNDKAAYTAVRLRYISPQVFARALRPPFNWGYGADLRGVNLRGADLRWANLSEADLRWASLRGANLRWANLSETNLREVNLRGADLRRANLRWANLSEADLRWADLGEADLREVNLNWANMREASLRGANLCWADLSNASLREASLRGADYNKPTIWPEGFDETKL